MEKDQLNKIISHFEILGTPVEVKPLGDGLINDTFIVKTAETTCPNYVLQRINHHVFTNVSQVMKNIAVVTDHIREKYRQQGVEDINRKVLRYIPVRKGMAAGTEKGDNLYVMEEGNYWRMMEFIPSKPVDLNLNEESSRAVGMTFGNFQSMLSDLKEPLEETISNFHNMEFRLEQLEDALQKDVTHRAKEKAVQVLLEQIDARRQDMCQAERLGREGVLPKRICHCDTKLNNILFDEQGNVLCVIDLDTVMPNFIFSDYGDFLRTAANTVAEDEPDFNRIQFKMDIFKAFTEGYLEATRDFLLPKEKELLPYAVQLFPYMQSVRFLWDYLSGDHYWKCAYPTHNLVRAQNQMAYLLRIEEAVPQMMEFIKGL